MSFHAITMSSGYIRDEVWYRGMIQQCAKYIICKLPLAVSVLVLQYKARGNLFYFLALSYRGGKLYHGLIFIPSLASMISPL